MARQKRHWTSEERAELWQRWRRGESLSDIARALDRKKGPVHRLVSMAGGFPPAERRRSCRVLSLQEREEVSRGVACGMSTRAIAGRLGRSPSTVSRELRRNGGREAYRAAYADEHAWAQARRPKPYKLAQSRRLRLRVAERLQMDWSPAQISAWLKDRFAADESMRVSHETIYRSLFVQARGVLKKELIAHLRTRRTTRRAKASTTRGQARGQIVDAISIRERPAEADDRAVPGHWEGDLLSGANHSYIATLVERHSRYTILVKLPNKEAATVRTALVKAIHRLPATLRRSLTWDRGLEMAQHKELTIATDVAVYFCDPKSPWQRGSNENTNGLLRQYFPKKMDLSNVTRAQLTHAENRLNGRPRKTLGFKTPAAKLASMLR
jgi:IS30 family transposase